jgi:protoheme IX farnesyltransferase
MRFDVQGQIHRLLAFASRIEPKSRSLLGASTSSSLLGTHVIRCMAGSFASSSFASTTSTSAIARPSRKGFFQALINDYKQLSKFRLSSLVVLTTAAGFVGASSEAIDWVKLGWTSLGTFASAACANTLNQIYEVHNDARMTRTASRPLPAGRLTRLHALAFAFAMGTGGLSILYTQTNAAATSLSAFNIALYAAVYTPLKQLSWTNTWVGALVGAIPPLIGWAATSSSFSLASSSSQDSVSWADILSPGSAVLAVSLFSWQMPHFMALAWLNKEDYIRGGYQMLSRVDPSGRRTAGVALRHSLLLSIVGLAAWGVGTASFPIVIEGAVMAAALGACATSFALSPSPSTARYMFRASLLHLPLLMLAFTCHRIPNQSGMVMTWNEVTEETLSGLQVISDGLMSIVSRVDQEMLMGFTRCPSKAAALEDSRHKEQEEK